MSKEVPPNTPQFYTLQETPSLNEQLKKAAALKAEIESCRPLAGNLWETIQEKLRLEWTYNSNAIEGNTLTESETFFFLREGITAEGKPFKDFMETKNHHDAISFLLEVTQGKRPISESLLKEINALLMRGIDHTTTGQYKKHPNFTLQADLRTVHRYVEPLQVPGEMEQLCEWINQNIESQHPVITSAIAHYNFVRIHPFDDGNGRGARILMNLILMKKAFPPAIIRNTDRRIYIETLNTADQGNLTPFVEFVTESLLETQTIMVDELKKSN